MGTRRGSGAVPQYAPSSQTRSKSRADTVAPSVAPGQILTRRTPKPQASDLGFSVELRRIELLTSSMPYTPRSLIDVR